jgi:probable HAF family extracellular repeat protein
MHTNQTGKSGCNFRTLARYSAVAAVCVAAAIPSLAQNCTAVNNLGGNYVTGYAINNSGVAVGQSSTANNDQHAFMFEDGQTFDLSPGSDFTAAYAISDRGVAAGVAYSGGGFRAVTFQNGTVTVLPTIGSWGQANGINEQGQVVGTQQDKNGLNHAFLYKNGTIQDLGTLGGNFSSAFAINNHGQVVGQANTPDQNTHAFLFQGKKITDLGTLGGLNSYAVAINDNGDIVGSSEKKNGKLQAFIYTGGRMLNIGTMGGDTSEAVAINNNGQVLGNSSMSDGSTHAFIWKDGVFTDLGKNPNHGIFLTPAGLNDHGQFIGYDDVQTEICKVKQ